MKQYESGVLGEDMAEAYLCKQGMTVLERRYRGGIGEIDLVMLDGACIVFVEVKARPSGMRGDGLAAVTRVKQRRITQAAIDFLQKREWMERMIRFDVVEISKAGILHIPNAFPAAY